MSKKVKLALQEASISIACLLDDVEVNKIGKFCPYLVADLEHIQNEITTIENFLDPFTVESIKEKDNE